MKALRLLAIPLLALSASPVTFADKLDDTRPAYSISFNSAPPFALPSIKNGDTLRVGFSIDDSVPVKGTPWEFQKALFKDVQIEVTLKDRKGKQVVKAWVQEAKSLDLTKYKAQLGDHFSGSISRIAYGWDAKACQGKNDHSKESKYYSPDLCNLPLKAGFPLKGVIEVATDSAPLGKLFLSLNKVDQPLADKSNNGSDPRASDSSVIQVVTPASTPDQAKTRAESAQ